MHRQAERLSKDGAAKAVEPTLIQLSKRWQDFESKFAQFRRLNYAQIVSCYWQTHMFATATTNSVLLTMRASGSVSTLQILIRKALLSASGGSFIYSNTIVICFGLKIALKLNQSIAKNSAMKNLFLFLLPHYFSITFISLKTLVCHTSILFTEHLKHESCLFQTTHPMPILIGFFICP